MKVRIEIESDQIAMPAEGLLLIGLGEANYVEVETGMGWVRLGAEALKELWQKLRGKEEAKKLVQIQ